MADAKNNGIGPDLARLPDNKVVRLSNVTCVYCGASLTRSTTSREHVIGRRFVPKGKLDGNWNLIVNACRACNNIKSGLEDDISAVTLQPDVFGRYGHEDDEVVTDAARKAEKSISRRTGMPVKHSHEEIAVNGVLGPGVSISFRFTGPPQVDQLRVFDLARMQIMGFFYWITYQKDRNRGSWWPGGFYPVLEAVRSDWGNPVHRAFAESVVDWEPRVLVINADGFYKIALRKHPEAACWSWALEWNHAMRVIGFCGDKDAARIAAKGLPKLKAETVSQGPNVRLAYRIDILLSEGDDKLFYWDGKF